MRLRRDGGSVLAAEPRRWAATVPSPSAFYPSAVPSLDVKTTPFLLLALLVGAGAVMLYRVPVQRYAVACERTTQVTCDLERATAAKTQRQHVPLGPNPSAVVRVVPRRRGG